MELPSDGVTSTQSLSNPILWQSVFTSEQEEHEREGVELGRIEIHDNQPCIDMLEKVICHSLLTIV